MCFIVSKCTIIQSIHPCTHPFIPSIHPSIISTSYNLLRYLIRSSIHLIISSIHLSNTFKHPCMLYFLRPSLFAAVELRVSTNALRQWNWNQLSTGLYLGTVLTAQVPLVILYDCIRNRGWIPPMSDRLGTGVCLVIGAVSCTLFFPVDSPTISVAGQVTLFTLGATIVFFTMAVGRSFSLALSTKLTSNKYTQMASLVVTVFCTFFFFFNLFVGV